MYELKAHYSMAARGVSSTGDVDQFVDHRITMALNVLSWLCDGQQKEMQDILREQKMFSVSFI